jgi:L-lactate utilization protein LutC
MNKTFSEYYEKTGNKIIKELEKRNAEGFYVQTREEACKKALSLIEEGDKVTFGGSVTLEETGLVDALKKGNYNLIDRKTAENQEEQVRLVAEGMTAHAFFMSTNAITMEGELVNIDGRGNRVALLAYGPKQVIVIVGMNKVVQNVEEGILRVQNVASPLNTIRLDRDTPCHKTGQCHDCHTTDCICSHIVITRHMMTPNRLKVILVGEDLGY